MRQGRDAGATRGKPRGHHSSFPPPVPSLLPPLTLPHQPPSGAVTFLRGSSTGACVTNNAELETAVARRLTLWP